MVSAEPAASFLPGSATQRPCAVSDLAGIVVHRPGGRRSISAMIWLLVVGAVIMLVIPAVTDVVGGSGQGSLAGQVAAARLKTVYRHHRVPVGAPLTTLIIDNPRVNVDVLVVEGTTPAALRAGAGHYAATPYPCSTAGNVGIAGYRMTPGQPFSRIAAMRPGDTATLVTPLSRCVYQVVAPGHLAVPAGAASNPFDVLPTNLTVVGQRGALGSGHWLTLTSSDSPGSTAKQVVLRLKLISCTGSTCPTGALA